MHGFHPYMGRVLSPVPKILNANTSVGRQSVEL